MDLVPRLQPGGSATRHRADQECNRSFEGMSTRGLEAHRVWYCPANLISKRPERTQHPPEAPWHVNSIPTRFSTSRRS